MSARRLAAAPAALLGTVLAVELLFGWRTHGIPLGNLVEGAIGGLLYGLVAVGVVLVHRASRVINFAQAALGSVPALLGILLVGEAGAPYVVGVLATLVAAVVVGVFVERAVLKPFLDRSRLILTVATIGVGQMLVLGELLLPRAFGRDSLVIPPVKTPLDGFKVSITGVRLDGNYLAVVVVSAALLAG